MMSDSDEEVSEALASPAPGEGSMRASVRQLLAATRELAEAELASAKIRTSLIADALRKWLMLAALALIFMMMSVVILIASAIIALAPYVGWLAASLIVAGVALIAAIFFAFIARRTFRDLFTAGES